MKKDKKISPLGNKLKALIRAANYERIVDFERESGVRHDSIRRLLGGYTKTLPMHDLVKVADKLKMSINELYAAGDGDVVTISNLVPGAKDPCWHQVRTDEMSPTFESGDLVLVDAGIKTANESGVYLVGTPTLSSLRRILVNTVDNSAQVRVDNKTYDFSEELSLNNLPIEGRVIGIFKRF